jgi:hypothetical protein
MNSVQHGRHTTDQVIRKLRGDDKLLAEGANIATVPSTSRSQNRPISAGETSMAATFARASQYRLRLKWAVPTKLVRCALVTRVVK